MASTGEAAEAPPSRRRKVRLVLLTILLLLLCLGWAGWQSVQGGRELQSARDELKAARSQLEQSADARPALQSAAKRTQAARGHFDDPVVHALSWLPKVGDPLRSARGISTAADLTVRSALLPLVEAAGPDPAEQLVGEAGRIDVDYLAELAPTADRSATAVAQAAAALLDAPRSTGVGRIDDAREELDVELTSLRGLVENAAAVTSLGPDLLGRGGVRRYLVVSQSPAEARGTGGLIGGYSLLEAADGKLQVVDSGPRSALEDPGRPAVDLGQEFDRHYGQNGPTSGWVNSNVSPHFPFAGQIWTTLWQRQHDEQLDGTVVLDPLALSYLLQATGPVTVADGEQVSAQNVVDATLRDVYARFDNDPARDQYLQSVSIAVASALTTRRTGGRALVDALQRSVEERRLRLWLSDAPLQGQIAARAVAGALPATPQAVGDVVVNASGSKLDYYLDRRLEYTPGCGGRSRLALTLVNGAPTTGLPDYVTPERLRPGRPPGTNRLIVTLYLPGSAGDVRLSVDGKPVALLQGTELGLTWAETTVDLLPGQRQVVQAEFSGAGSDAVERVVQPLVRPETFSAGSC